MRGKSSAHFEKKGKKAKAKKSSGVKNSVKFVSIVLVILLVYIIGMGVWFGLYMKSKIDQNREIVASEQELALQQAKDDVEAAADEASKTEAEKAEEQLVEASIFGNIPDKTFFGIYGVDQDEALSDVIIVACFDKNTRKITVLSIPRDTYVTLSDNLFNEMKSEGHYAPKTMKINAVHSWGGEDGDKYITEELEEMLGIPQISYYITINVEAFQKIVDDIGGITVDVPTNMYYTDATQDLYIDLKAGLQTLNGYQAMGLVRYRQYTNGDVDRVQVQQLFLDALFEQALSTEAILTNINSYVETFLTYVKTNMTVTDALRYTPFFPVLTSESLTMATLPGGLRSGDSGYFINSEYTAKLVDILFYDGDGNPDDYSGLSWGTATSDSAEAVATHEERDLDEVDNGNAIESSIDYTELARLNDKDQYIQKINDIIADYPEPSDESREVIAKYIEFASSAYCHRAYYAQEGGTNTATVNAEALSGLNSEVKSFSDEMVGLFRDANIGLLRDVLPTARADISGFDFDAPINIVIEEDILEELTDMDRLTLLIGDNLHIVQAETDDLETILDKYGSFTITFSEESKGYSISFTDENGAEIYELPAPVYFGFFSADNMPACYLTTASSVENVGGKYDGNNKVLLFAATEPGSYSIQDVTTSYFALEYYGEAKKQRMTEFLTRGFMSADNLDIDGSLSVTEYMDILSNMLKKDADELLSSLNIEKDGNLTNGQLLSTCGTLLNLIKHNYYPENTDYYLGLYNINDNQDEYDNSVALAISCDLVSFSGDSLLCKAEATQGDILNVLSNAYNLISPVAVAEYSFTASEAPEITEEETGSGSYFELNEDTVFSIIVLSVFGLVALLIIIAFIALFIKARKDARLEAEAEAAKEAAREAEKERLRRELYYYEHGGHHDKYNDYDDEEYEDEDEYDDEEYEYGDDYDDEYYDDYDDEEYEEDDEYYDEDEEEYYDDDDEDEYNK